MKLRDYIFKILKEQIFLEDTYNCNQKITNPNEQRKVEYFIKNSGLKRKEICELAVGDPTHNILGPLATKHGFEGEQLKFLDAMIEARKKGIPIEDIIAEAKRQYNDVKNGEIKIKAAVENVRNMSLVPKPEESNRVSYFDLVS